jgi:3-hydroxyisobutyrate dehydrogenase
MSSAPQSAALGRNRIGVCGIGRMGAAIAQRLLLLGHPVNVWNRTRAKAEAIAGAAVADTPAALARDCDIIISIMTDDKALHDAYFGGQGLIAGASAGKLFIEMSTVLPDTETALAAAAAAKGALFIDSPVGGTVGPARDGKLFAFVGGSDAAFEQARPLLETMCRRIEHLGPVGSGALMKLAINLPLLAYWQVFGEALALVKPLNLPGQRLIDIFSDTSGAPATLRTRGPALAAKLDGKDSGAVTIHVDGVRKDMRTMLEAASKLGITLPVVSQALKIYDQASGEGLGDADVVNLPAYWRAAGR